MNSIARLVLTYIVLSGVILPGGYSASARDKELLYDSLLTGYNTNVRPGVNQSEATQVDTGFSFVNIQEYDEKTERLSMVGYFSFAWTDERLSWIPDNYNNTTALHAPTSSVWIPNLLLVNPYHNMHRIGHVENSLTVGYNGEVIWLQGDIFVVSCLPNIAYYPFDEQVCTFQFTLWGYFYYEVIFNLIASDFDYSYFRPNGKWSITKTAMRSEISNHGFQFIYLDFKFVRLNHFQVINTIVPVIVLEMIQALVFLLPVDSGERVGFATTMLLAITLYMTIVSDRLPDISYPNISYLSYFLLTDVIMGMVLVMCLVQSLRLHHSPDKMKTPSCLKSLRNIFKRPPTKISTKQDSEKIAEYLPYEGNLSVDKCEDTSDTPVVCGTWQTFGDSFDKGCVVWFMFINVVKIIVLFAFLGTGSK